MSRQPRDTSQNIGQIMIYLAWILFLGLLTFAFNRFLDRQNNPNQDIAFEYGNNNIAEARLIQNHQGHYVVNGKINGYLVTFLVDTGATHISIPIAIADRLNLSKGYPARAVTANGSITVYNTRLKSVSIGAIELHDIRASINPNMPGDEILLGMSFMKHLEIIQRGKELILRKIY